MDTKLHNVRILRDGEWQTMEVGIEGGRFSDIAATVSGPCCESIDAAGAYCLPGGVDLHVHFNEPGRTHWEGFKTGTAAAAAGGVTSLVEMPLNSIPSTTSLAALDLKLKAIEGKSYVDYGLWGGLVPGNLDELEPLADAGVCGFKAFMSPSGTDDFINSDTETLRAGMQRIARTGLRLALHAEDPAVLEPAAARLAQRESATDWEASRPVEAEVSAVRIAIELSKETGCPITIVHVSAPEVLDVIDAAKAEGVDILCETCPHYLLLDLEDAERIGPAAKCAPPLRPHQVVDAQWAAVLAGRIDTIGSDHSPCPPEMKTGRDFYSAWGGISGLQHGLPLLFDRVSIGAGPDMGRLVDMVSTRPAAIMGMKGKGQLGVGADADFVLIRPSTVPRSIAAEDLLYRHRHSAYCGMTQRLEVQSSWLRGQCVFTDGHVQGEPSGAFLRGKGGL
ncbi:allantoinase AllB [Coraliomargarita parva]|uniref:allantoinase AllB n=1 Tax=Coraliomargarita parva TaxID=3014050 RepID=UPI0022B5CE99|nr:allantoinase AllB [Coraliomargarita parva]